MYTLQFVIWEFQGIIINETNLIGIVENYKIDGDKVTITFISNKEKLVGNYYLKSIDEKNNIINELKYGSSINVRGVLSNPLNNTVPNRIYDDIIDYAWDIGIRNAFIQEGGTQSDSFIPKWDFKEQKKG